MLSRQASSQPGGRPGAGGSADGANPAFVRPGHWQRGRYRMEADCGVASGLTMQRAAANFAAPTNRIARHRRDRSAAPAVSLHAADGVDAARTVPNYL